MRKSHQIEESRMMINFKIAWHPRLTLVTVKTLRDFSDKKKRKSLKQHCPVEDDKKMSKMAAQ